MTDDQTLTETDESSGAGETGSSAIDGRTAWPWIKDGGLLLFAVFFGAVFLVLRSIGMDDATGASGPGGVGGGPIELSLTEFAIDGNLETSSGTVTIRAVNDGDVDHNIVIPELGVRSEVLKPGEETTIDLGQVSSRTYSIFCDLPGHREGGMENELVIG